MAKKLLKIGEAISEVADIKIDGVEAKTVSVGAEEVTGAPEAKSITVGDTTYSISAGGGGTTVEASTQLVEGASTANSLKIGDTDWNLPQGGGGASYPVIDFGELTLLDPEIAHIFSKGVTSEQKEQILALNCQPFIAKYSFKDTLRSEFGEWEFNMSCLMATSASIDGGELAGQIFFSNTQNDMSLFSLNTVISIASGLSEESIVVQLTPAG